MSWKDDYKKKLVSVEDAAAVIKSNDRVFFAPVCSAPQDVVNAINKRKDELTNVEMFSALLLYPFEHFKGEYKGHIGHNTFFQGPVERKFYAQGNINQYSYHFGDTTWFTENSIKPDIYIADVSVPDEKGNMSLGPVGTFNGYQAAKLAKKVIVQVNREVPYVYGAKEAFLNIADVDYICEQDHKVPELPSIPLTDMEKTIAHNIIPYIENGSTIQIGVGGLGNAVGFYLEHHKNLGVHTEMFVDSMVHLAEIGVINGSKKTFHPGEITACFSIGSKKLYDFINKNKNMKQYELSYINNENNIGKNDNFVSINNAIMCDLTGQVCSESIGFQQFSATGGQLNFVRGARLSKGGKAFLTLESTAKLPDGTVISRILSALPPGEVITTPRSDVDYICTEYGAVNLRGKSIAQRVKAMISIAHPDFREKLEKEAKEAKMFF
jgi:4-hydroxybutyrate CoA-transferase